MFHVCPRCGIYDEAKEIDPGGPFAVCPHCGYAHRFLQQPLFIVTGASGAGKSATCLAILDHLPECVVLDSDVLWDPRFNTPQDHYRAYRALWLRLALNIAQSGRPVMLFGSAIPAQFEDLPGRRYFRAIHYLALVCDPAVLAARLEARPAWRNAHAGTFVSEMQAFNGWLQDHAATTAPPMTLFDTGVVPVAETVAFTCAWARALLL